MKILVTGGAGYIGSHTCVELLNNGYEVVVMDNLYNASEKAVERVQQITGKTLKFYNVDMLDQPAMDQIFEAEKPDAVIHFAGYKAVGESVAKPIEYYHNNMTGTLLLCDTMRKHGCKNIIFSSSATVYGDPLQIPISEECPKQNPTNPYGQSFFNAWSARNLMPFSFTFSFFRFVSIVIPSSHFSVGWKYPIDRKSVV